MNELQKYMNDAESGDPEAQVYVGWLLYRGDPPKYSEAKDWFEKAAKSRKGEASFYLGKISEFEKKVENAKQHYMAASLSGFWPAYYRLGAIHQVSGNIDEANNFYEKGVEYGHLYCMRQLSVNMMCSKKPKNMLKGLNVFFKAIVLAFKVVSLEDDCDYRLRY